MSYVTVPFRVSFPVFLFFLLTCRGHDLSVSLHPGIKSQDVLKNTTTTTSTQTTTKTSLLCGIETSTVQVVIRENWSAVF